MRFALLSFAALAPFVLAGAAPYSVPLSVARCRPMAADTARSLGADWGALAAFAQRCSVPGPDRRPALSVDVIRLDQAYRIDFFATHPDQQIPQPIIRDPHGTVVGQLGEQFPEEPPGRLKVTFARWRAGWPQEIRLYQAGESALPPHPLPPMRWDARTRTYREQR